MKTIRFLSGLSFVLLFVGISASLATKTNPPGAVSVPATSIQYIVVIHPTFMTTPCTTYLVEVLDETGRLVAPAQTFIPGTDKYVFREKISKPDPASRRVAMLVPLYFPEDFVCADPLVTPPAVEQGPFLVGQTYILDLYPHNPGHLVF